MKLRSKERRTRPALAEAGCYFLGPLSSCAAICLCHPAHTNPSRCARFHPSTYYSMSLCSYIRQLAGSCYRIPPSPARSSSFPPLLRYHHSSSPNPVLAQLLLCCSCPLPCYLLITVLTLPIALCVAQFFNFSSSKALQALQRQPNAAQYFQQLMLQQQINSAQLQNLAAVQQVKVRVSLSVCKSIILKQNVLSPYLPKNNI